MWKRWTQVSTTVLKCCKKIISNTKRVSKKVINNIKKSDEKVISNITKRGKKVISNIWKSYEKFIRNSQKILQTVIRNTEKCRRILLFYDKIKVCNICQHCKTSMATFFQHQGFFQRWIIEHCRDGILWKWKLCWHGEYCKYDIGVYIFYCFVSCWYRHTILHITTPHPRFLSFHWSSTRVYKVISI